MLSGVTVAALYIAFGFRIWMSGICFALCGMVTGTIVQEFWRGATVRRQNTGTDLFTALIGLVGRNKRRYGGYIVHFGVVFIFLGFAGEGFKEEQERLFRPGEQTTIGRYDVRYDSVKVSDDGQKQMITAYITVLEGGQEIDTLYPAKWYFHGRDGEPPTTEVAIRRGFGEDLYVVGAAFDLATQEATLQVFVNPLVNWVWFGFALMALRHRHRAAAGADLRVRAGQDARRGGGHHGCGASGGRAEPAGPRAGAGSTRRTIADCADRAAEARRRSTFTSASCACAAPAARSRSGPARAATPPG